MGIRPAVGTSEIRRFSAIVTGVDRLIRTRPWPFRVDVYRSHAAFARALEASQGQIPAGLWDTDGNIVNGVMPLQAVPGNAKHRLAHIYAEWVFSRLTHTQVDLPWPAWLFAGLAEAAAQRVAPGGRCLLRGYHPFSLAALSRPATWWRLRHEGAGAVEYCEARLAAQRIVRRLGWSRIDRRLRRSRSWLAFARAVYSS
jgi:hypothetical protein